MEGGGGGAWNDRCSLSAFGIVIELFKVNASQLCMYDHHVDLNN